jgi:hypothetical protein
MPDAELRRLAIATALGMDTICAGWPYESWAAQPLRPFRVTWFVT